VQEGVSEQEALANGMEAKAVEFVKQGAQVYRKAYCPLLNNRAMSLIVHRASQPERRRT
jgi:hypothetical protein